MTEHYFTVEPGSAHQPREITVTLRGNALRLKTDAGVFSRDRLDLGTKILVESLDLAGVRAPLDLGCGYGPIGLTMARELPAVQVYMSDLNRRATELANENAALNGITNVLIRQGDGFEPWRDLYATGFRFDLVAINPPLRAGKETVLRLFTEARDFLAPAGQLWAVIRTSQGAKTYLRELQRIFPAAETAAIKSGYRVLRARMG
ncbi:MAG TPA: class I SAM-dependent methyltransferase [Firmicutes bacterium]|uniref:Class I SAM-dependent methyltransferase n=1 Tax=Capillibacterium thermochitinicola TaxID=2699427 RepID=A0A8J6I2F2_9FIRM|nr:methyltransferase [Capillibacterium thermochitinicola]MBA2133027.1 class I SAM-dependent methyltransferase [Capillibacterium thermochitinicola]HHW13000.1 class I SAM-dependent methyltransferase [Bacillota bacterium]